MAYKLIDGGKGGANIETGGDGEIEEGEGEGTPKNRPRKGKTRRFTPDYRAPTLSKTTKLRSDQHRCLKEEVAAWVTEKYPEHPNLSRILTIEFLIQMAIDELLTDKHLVERIVERIQRVCLPG